MKCEAGQTERELAGAVRDWSAGLAPRIADAEREGALPVDVIHDLGELGVLGMGVPEADGGLGASTVVFALVLEELAAAWPSLAVGQRVRLESGPLCGLEGVVIQEGMRDRICVSVTLLQRGVSVEVDRDWIRPLSPARIPPTHSSGVLPKSRDLSAPA